MFGSVCVVRPNTVYGQTENSHGLIKAGGNSIRSIGVPERSRFQEELPIV
jgi:uncharacterized membrane protein